MSLCRDVEGFPCNQNVAVAISLGASGGIVSLLFVLYLHVQIKANPRGNQVMNDISDQIKSGARAFLKTEYRYLTMFAALAFTALLVLYTIDPVYDKLDGVRYGVSFLAGGGFSALAGWNGMMVATDANVRTAQAAKDHGLGKALRVALTGGAVMGFNVVGLGLLGLSVFYWLLTTGYDETDDYVNEQSSSLFDDNYTAGENYDQGDVDLAARLHLAANAITGFGFGASSIAIFARVAGGIYTKAADVGADLVGKVEMNIPEDDPRNPAVIADNVGDNVGDVAGMGADLFESFVGSIIAAVSLSDGSIHTVMLPFWISGAGVVASILGFFAVRTNNDATQQQLNRAMLKGTLVSTVSSLIFSRIITRFVFREEHSDYGVRISGCIAIGLFAGVFIGQSTEYFTSYSYWPVKSIVAAGVFGPATVIIQGLGVGMVSTVIPTLFLVAAILGCQALAGGYGVAIAAVGMLSTLGATLATDAYGPIADNAGGIAEMAHLDKRVRTTTDALDALGNTTAATGKGFAIGSAVLTALSLMAAFKKRSGIEKNGLSVEIDDPVVLAGALIGAVLPFLFAALTMFSVQKAAGAIIMEVRRQFAEIPGLREGTAAADSDRCVSISTQTAVHEMILPGLYALLAPIIVGFLVGPRCLIGLLGGSIVSGMMLAIMMSNSGGAWDNAKKYIEVEGAHGGKGTEIHKACVVGDTVGDPFKDTAGPALNILIKLMSIVSLTIAPFMDSQDNDWDHWYYGLVPLFVLLCANYVVYLLFWRNAPPIPIVARSSASGSHNEINPMVPTNEHGII